MSKLNREIDQSFFWNNKYLFSFTDGEEVGGGDLFRAFLVNIRTDQYENHDVHLVCLENPPSLYETCNHYNKKITVHDFFSDPCRWDDSSDPDLKTFLSSFNNEISHDKILCLDALHELVIRLGFCTTYKLLHKLNSCVKNIVCLAHESLFKEEELGQLLSLAGTVIRLKSQPNNLDDSLKKDEKLAEIAYRKLSGKISTQNEIYTVSENFKVLTQVHGIKKSKDNSSNIKSEFNSLTTFELGLDMKEAERKAKKQLVLPYLRNKEKEGGGIIYHLENLDLEDDPDDDLDI